mgnify:CR=1 FL=1
MYFEKIAELISEKIDCPVEDITNETKFSDLAMNLEDEFSITLEMTSDIATVGDLVKKIETLVGEKNA